MQSIEHYFRPLGGSRHSNYYINEHIFFFGPVSREQYIKWLSWDTDDSCLVGYWLHSLDWIGLEWSADCSCVELGIAVFLWLW